MLIIYTDINCQTWGLHLYARNDVKNKVRHPKNAVIKTEHHRVMHPKDADRMTVKYMTKLLPQEQSDLGLHCLSSPVCPIIMAVSLHFQIIIMKLGHVCCSKQVASCTRCNVLYEPRHEKTCLRGFPPGKTQTKLVSDRDELESWNFGFSKYRYYTK